MKKSTRFDTLVKFAWAFFSSSLILILSGIALCIIDTDRIVLEMRFGDFEVHSTSIGIGVIALGILLYIVFSVTVTRLSKAFIDWEKLEQDSLSMPSYDDRRQRIELLTKLDLIGKFFRKPKS